MAHSKTISDDDASPKKKLKLADDDLDRLSTFSNVNRMILPKHTDRILVQIVEKRPSTTFQKQNGSLQSFTIRGRNKETVQMVVFNDSKKQFDDLVEMEVFEISTKILIKLTKPEDRKFLKCSTTDIQLVINFPADVSIVKDQTLSNKLKPKVKNLSQLKSDMILPQTIRDIELFITDISSKPGSKMTKCTLIDASKNSISVAFWDRDMTANSAGQLVKVSAIRVSEYAGFISGSVEKGASVTVIDRAESEEKYDWFDQHKDDDFQPVAGAGVSCD